MSGQKGKVHLGPNVSSSAHNRGCVVNGNMHCKRQDLQVPARSYYCSFEMKCKQLCSYMCRCMVNGSSVCVCSFFCSCMHMFVHVWIR